MGGEKNVRLVQMIFVLLQQSCSLYGYVPFLFRNFSLVYFNFICDGLASNSIMETL